MPSFPPYELDNTRPTALASFEAAPFARSARDEGVIFFCVENAPRELCRTRVGGDGSLTFETHLSGRVLAVQRDAIILDVSGREVQVRHLLPSSIRLDALIGRKLQIRLVQQYQGRCRATIDAEIRDAAGRLILWARDGRFPSDRYAHGLTLRASVDANETRLAVRAGDRVVSVPCPGVASLQVGARDLTLALVRLGAEDIGFVLLRR